MRVFGCLALTFRSTFGLLALDIELPMNDEKSYQDHASHHGNNPRRSFSLATFWTPRLKAAMRVDSLRSLAS